MNALTEINEIKELAKAYEYEGGDRFEDKFAAEILKAIGEADADNLDDLFIGAIESIERESWYGVMTEWLHLDPRRFSYVDDVIQGSGAGLKFSKILSMAMDEERREIAEEIWSDLIEQVNEREKLSA